MQSRNDRYTYADKQYGRDKYLGINVYVKHRGELIVKPKTIKFKENIFCYIFFYLHYNFFDILSL